MIEAREAGALLSDIDRIGRDVRRSLLYRRTSSMLLLWGPLVFIGYLLTFLIQGAAGIIWPIVIAAGIGGSVIIGAVSARREGVHTFDARMFTAFVVFIAFGCVWSIALGGFSPRQLAAFWASYFMLPYIMLGVWIGRAFVAIGVSVIALTVIGYYVAGSWFTLWMAVVNGGGLLLGGWWMRRG